MKKVTYVGTMLQAIVGDIVMKRYVPTELPDELAQKIVKEIPKDFKLATTKSLVKKKEVK